jgi:hypothetical protein
MGEKNLRDGKVQSSVVLVFLLHHFILLLLLLLLLLVPVSVLRVSAYLTLEQQS